MDQFVIMMVILINMMVEVMEVIYHRISFYIIFLSFGQCNFIMLLLLVLFYFLMSYDVL